MTAATHQGVAPEEVDGRGADIEAIANRIMESRGLTPEEPEEVEEAEEETTEEETEEETTEEPPELPEAAEDTEQTVTLKVDGKEVNVPLSKVLEAGKRTYQKEAAADKRLEEATTLKRQVEQLAQMLQHQQLPPAPQAQPQQQDPVEKWAEALQYGTKEDAVRAIREIQQQAQGQADPAQFMQMMELRMNNMQIQQRFAAPPEQGGYGDIYSDPYLREMAVLSVEKRRQAGDTRIGWELYDEVGRELREWRDSKFAPQPKVASMADKVAKKRQLDPVQTSARVEQKQDKPVSRSDLIAEMRKGRMT